MNTFQYGLRLIRLFHHYRKRSVHLPYLPVRMWVELTSDCNYRCVMCPNKDLSEEERGFMEMELFRKIVDEASTFVFEINLAHRGESLLHPGIIEAIEYAKHKKLFTRLHTNGALLDEELSRKILRAGLDRLSFSFDGYDKETYEKIRRGGQFEGTVRNIVRFLEIKKEEGAKKPETAIEVINFKENARSEDRDSREEFRSRFDGLPLNSFVFKELHNWAGELNTKKDKHKHRYSPCPFPWNALIVCWDGSVIPCTQDFFNLNPVGQAAEDTLRNIWNGEKMKALRKKLGEGEIQELRACSRCDRVWREGILGVPKEYLWKFITKRMP